MLHLEMYAHAAQLHQVNYSRGKSRDAALIQARPGVSFSDSMIAAGTRLGPYEILAALGAGGMGEVYKGRDTRLNRSVAIKVLPPHLSNPDFKLRFDREARVISGFTHPHNCALHDVGEEAGLGYLVMEYCEGETLAQGLEKGALPVEQVLKYGVQIAEALDRAP